MTPMQGGVWSKHAAVVAFALLATSLVGCSEESLATTPAGFRTGPDQVVGVSGLKDGWKVIDDPDGQLLTPFTSFAIDRVKRAKTLTAADCQVIECGLDEHGEERDGLKAADGEDLVAVIFTAPERRPSIDLITYGEVTAGSTTDTLDVEVIHNLTAGLAANYIVSVPDDAKTVDLSLDHGDDITATVDLLTGKLADDEDSQRFTGYRDVAPASVEPSTYDVNGTMTARSRDRERFVNFPFEATWTVSGTVRWAAWLPSWGWPEPGRAWLVLSSVSGTVHNPDGPNVELLSYKADIARSFTITPTGGEPIEATWNLVDLGTRDPFPVVFEVPAGVTSGTVTLQMHGLFGIHFYGIIQPPFDIDWAKGSRPEPFEFEFDLTESAP